MKYIKDIIKLPIIILWVCFHIVAILVLMLSYPYARLRYYFKPNLNNRPFIFRGKLVNKMSAFIDKIFGKII